MAFATGDDEMQLNLPTTEVIRSEGQSLSGLAPPQVPRDPLAIPSATLPKPPTLHRRGSTKCTSCARSKKRKYKVLATTEIYLTTSVKLILVRLMGRAWIAKREVGRLIATKPPVYRRDAVPPTGIESIQKWKPITIN